MKSELLISLSVHLILVGGLMFFKQPTPLLVGKPAPIQVKLVALPPAAVTVQVPPTPQVKKPEPPPPKGVTFTEIKKPKKKKVEEKKPVATAPEPRPVPFSEATGSSRFGEAVLDAPDFSAPYYVDLILNQINNHWINPVSSSYPLSCVIYFKIQRSGKVTDIKVEAGSGISAFDRAALRAVLSSDPLPPLPEEYSGEQLGIHLEFAL